MFIKRLSDWIAFFNDIVLRTMKSLRDDIRKRMNFAFGKFWAGAARTRLYSL